MQNVWWSPFSEVVNLIQGNSSKESYNCIPTCRIVILSMNLAALCKLHVYISLGPMSKMAFTQTKCSLNQISNDVSILANWNILLLKIRKNILSCITSDKSLFPNFQPTSSMLLFQTHMCELYFPRNLMITHSLA